MTFPFPTFAPVDLSRLEMLSVVNALGLGTNLKLCLDAGDASSYGGSGQTWADRSGGGYDFYLGTGSSADSSDPAFNGSAGGKSANEYFSFDGADLFTYETSNAAWMSDMHKDNAKYAFCSWVYVKSSANTQGIWGTMANDTAGNGAQSLIDASNKLVHMVYSNGADLLQASGAASVPDQWNFLAVSCDEAAGANGLIMQVNGVQELYTSTYAAPTTNAASGWFTVGALGQNAGFRRELVAGSRMASFLMWDGTALSALQMTRLFQATRGKFGV
jgi:hypothetical protein